MGVIRFKDEMGEIRVGRLNGPDTAEECLEKSMGMFEATGRVHRVRTVLAPVEPRAIFCIGLNYRAHALETGAPIPEYPVVFMKNPASVIGPGQSIVLPQSCRDPLQVDFEVELAVVIGKAAKNVTEEKALSHVKGYMVANDVSARIWQKNGGGGQWVRGKSFDTFCPLGPELISAHDIADPNGLELSLRLNGELMQKSNTSDMIFPVKKLIAFLSEDTTLLPDTVILTGTPSGVGYARSPRVFLKPGDRLELSIEHIGILENSVI
ncbi:MAG: fumarylacetoacetate hydrolase family protein [Proteobacteria bacterium]|nr:fumarylacetoacetate hydrolase family protein [Pseudomonadota bacterium]